VSDRPYWLGRGNEAKTLAWRCAAVLPHEGRCYLKTGHRGRHRAGEPGWYTEFTLETEEVKGERDER